MVLTYRNTVPGYLPWYTWKLDSRGAVVKGAHQRADARGPSYGCRVLASDVADAPELPRREY